MAARTHRTRARGRWKMVLALVALTLMVAVVVAIVAGWSVFYRESAAQLEPGLPATVEIPPGSSTASIANILAEQGVVSNANMFRLDSRMAKADGKLRAGTYELETGMSNSAVIEKLLAGPPINYVTVTIPEGFVIDQVAARLEAQAGIPADEFLAIAKGGAQQLVGERPYLEGVYNGSLEGYLFPKTYRIREGTDAKGAIDMMLDQFEKEMEQVDVAAVEARGLSHRELVVMASMIERETMVDKERPLVASVIYNRLSKNMRLEIDATVEYVLPGNRLRLTYKDIAIDSPYNTYRNHGLPAGPIASPGLASLKAVAEPADADYLYYVLTGKDGSHTFTTNLKDHNRAKAKSKEVFGK